MTIERNVKGLLGTKLGMTQLWDENNRIVPVTVIAAGTNVVTQVRTPERDGYNAIQVGFGEIVVFFDQVIDQLACLAVELLGQDARHAETGMHIVGRCLEYFLKQCGCIFGTMCLQEQARPTYLRLHRPRIACRGFAKQ